MYGISTHWTTPTGIPLRPITVPGHDICSTDITNIAGYGIVPTLRYDSQKNDGEIIRCALKVVVTHEESSSALAKWRCLPRHLGMSEASQVPSFFRFQHMM